MFSTRQPQEEPDALTEIHAGLANGLEVWKTDRLCVFGFEQFTLFYRRTFLDLQNLSHIKVLPDKATEILFKNNTECIYNFKKRFEKKS